MVALYVFLGILGYLGLGYAIIIEMAKRNVGGSWIDKRKAMTLSRWITSIIYLTAWPFIVVLCLGQEYKLKRKTL